MGIIPPFFPQFVYKHLRIGLFLKDLGIQYLRWKELWMCAHTDSRLGCCFHAFFVRASTCSVLIPDREENFLPQNASDSDRAMCHSRVVQPSPEISKLRAHGPCGR